MTEHGHEAADHEAAEAAEDQAATDDPAEATHAEADAPPSDPHGAVLASWGCPAFARGFPRHAELDSLVAAFARGDYLTVRTHAPKLAASPDVPAPVRRAAALLRTRIEPDKSARTLFALTAALLAFLTVWWATHDGPDHRSTAPATPPPAVEFVK